MRAQVRDSAALSLLIPQNVAAYLRAHGWNQFSLSDGRFSIWHHPEHSDAEILLPVDRQNRDYPLQIAEALNELEAVENRSQLEILRDLRYSGFDVVRLSAKSPSSRDGSLEIEAGVQLFESARSTLYAAACAAVRPQAVFYSRKPVLATEYMRKARLGQTEHGSYVLTLLSPVTPQLTSGIGSLLSEPPFERVVVETLARSVRSAVAAARSAVPDSDFEPFTASVNQGVSANLCEAIVGLFSSPDVQSVELSVAWATNRLVSNDIPSQVTISGDIAPILSEAASLFRASDALRDYTIRGPVVKLQRLSSDGGGTATIVADVEGVLRNVSIELSAPDYSLAVEAHANYWPIEITGTIRKQGRSFWLFSQGSVAVARDSDSPVQLF